MPNTVEPTEITDFDADSLHLVKEGANGFPALLAKAKQEVELVGKAEADDVQDLMTGDKQDATKAPGVPDNATKIPTKTNPLPKWPANSMDTSLSSSESGKVQAVTPDEGRGKTSPGAVGGGVAVAIPAANAAVNPANSVASQITAGAAKASYPYAFGKLVQFMEQVEAQRAGAAIKEPWVVVQNTNREGIDAVADRLAEFCRVVGNDPAPTTEAVKAAFDNALAIAAHLAFAAEESDVTKSAFSLSAFSTQSLSSARDQINEVLAAKTKPSTEVEEIMFTMTKEELEKEIAAGSKKALKKNRKELKKALKTITAALKANGNKPGSTSNNKGEASEGDIRGMVVSRQDADEIGNVPNSNVTKAEGETAVVAPEKVEKQKVKKAKKNSLKKQLAEIHETVSKMAKQPRVGGPHLTGAPVGPVTEGRQGETVAKSAEDAEIDSLQKQFDELLKSTDPMAPTRLQDVGYRLSQKRLAKMHREGKG